MNNVQLYFAIGLPTLTAYFDPTAYGLHAVKKASAA
jgi:hypothetical protein